MQDNANYSYVSTVVTPDQNTHYIKDAEARSAITGLETSKQNVINSSNKLSASYVSGLATVATSGSYNDLSNKPTIPPGVTVDTAMSSTSENAVQNKVIKTYVDNAISGLGSVLNYKGTKSSESAIKAITSAKVGDVWINTADNSEWVCKQTITTATASAWEQLGPTIDLSGYAKTSDLGSLAYKSSASGSYTPAGSITINSYKPAGTMSYKYIDDPSQPSQTTSAIHAIYSISKETTSSGNAINITPSGSVTIDSYTPEGTISVGSGTSNYTPAGSVTINSITPSGTISSGSGTANYTPAGSITINSITPAGTISVGTGTANYTPAGTISMDNYTPEGTISSVTIDGYLTSVGMVEHTGSGTANYTPSGTISAPTITVTPSTTTVNSITSVGTLPSFTATVASETLTLGFSPGTLPTKGSNTTVATGIQSATATAPTFTGKGVDFQYMSGTQTVTPTFTGTAKKPTGSFSGTGKELKFTGTAVTPTGSFSGTGTRLAFTGTAVTPTGSFSGTGARLIFTGTDKTPTGSFTGDSSYLKYVKYQYYTSFTGSTATLTGSFSGTAATVTVS